AYRVAPYGSAYAGGDPRQVRQVRQVRLRPTIRRWDDEVGDHGGLDDHHTLGIRSAVTHQGYPKILAFAQPGPGRLRYQSAACWPRPESPVKLTFRTNPYRTAHHRSDYGSELSTRRYVMGVFLFLFLDSDLNGTALRGGVGRRLTVNC